MLYWRWFFRRTHFIYIKEWNNSNRTHKEAYSNKNSNIGLFLNEPLKDFIKKQNTNKKEEIQPLKNTFNNNKIIIKENVFHSNSVITRIKKELNDFNKDPPANCSVNPFNDSDLTHCQGIIIGLKTLSMKEAFFFKY